MIKVRGTRVTFTGIDATQLLERSAQVKQTPQQYVCAALREAIKRSKKKFKSGKTGQM